MRLRQLAIRTVALLAIVSAGLTARAASATELAAHRALYTLTLGTTKGGDVAAATGRMAYEVIDACDGWAVRQRLEMTITNRDGQDIQMQSDYTTWESKDGLKLRFRMKQTTDTAVTSEVAGDATLDAPGGPGIVHYTVPDASTKTLPAGTLFPMAHTAAILAAAEAGKKALFIPLFDGTTADGAQDSSVAVVRWNPPAATKWADLSKLANGRVHVAFFDRTAGTQQPDYEVSMRYWENGVADELAMDFGDFVMNGKLAEYVPQKSGC
jgi:hypothetical protein